jgi:uncharacterized GH25 family protein
MARTNYFKASFILLLVVMLGSLAMPAQAQSGEKWAEERAIDRQHMKQIYDALMAFKKDKGQLPDWLSDLFPKYLTDPEVLVSPVEKATGESRLFGYDDPKMKTSYIYEFGGAMSGRKGNDGKTLTMREWKKIQMESFGEVIPILRCHHHDPVLNMSYSGELFETVLFWETDPHTLALMKKLGPGKVGKPERILRLKAFGGENQPLEGVEIGSEKYETSFGPLAPRTVVTDAKGQVECPIGPGKAINLALKAVKPGYAMAQVSWEQDSIPDEYTFKLVKAIEAGGVVQANSGEKISGASITVNGIARDAVGQSYEVQYDTVVSDAQGQWFTDKIPSDFASLSLRVQHKEFFTGEFEQAEASDEKSFTREKILAKAAVLILEPGIQVTGRVTDESGNPIADAKISMAANEALKDKATIAADAKGNFKIMRLETGILHLIATAKQFAPLYLKVEVERGVKPLVFELKKGRNWRFKVVDAANQPLRDAKVKVELWNDLRLLSWSAKTGENGACSWDSAPLDKVTMTATKDEFAPQSETTDAADNSEIVFELKKLFKISGTAIDADTKKPIDRFKVYRGYVNNYVDGDQTRWENYNMVEGRNGAYSVPPGQSGGGDSFKYLAVADGYMPAETPKFQTQEPQIFNFELKKGKGPEGQVLLPGGEPAADAQVAICGWGYLSLSKAAFKSNSSDKDILRTTDSQGRFSLPALMASPDLIVVHKEGFAELPSVKLGQSNIVTLQPWAAIKGVYKFGTKPGTNVMLMVTHERSGMRSINYDWEQFKTETDENGKFSFTHVPPGHRAMVRLIQTSPRSWSWSHIREIDLAPGQTLDMVYGGEGQPVKGKMVPPDSSKSIDWQNTSGHFGTRNPEPAGPRRTSEEQKAYYKSDEYKEAMKKMRNYAFKVQDDGSFFIDNVPAGEYSFRVEVREPGNENNPWSAPLIGTFNKDVKVPEAPGGCTDVPMDLGELKLKTEK